MNADIPFLEILVAMGRDRSIGQAGIMPWHLPEDLKNFQMLTADHVMLMGRKTFQSLGRVLKNRPHFVVSRMSDAEFLQMVSAFPNPTQQPVIKCSSLEDFLCRLAGYQEASKTSERVFLIGGADLYKQALDRRWVSSILVTQIDSFFHDADTFFPEIPADCFFKESQGPWLNSTSGLRYRMLRYVNSALQN